MSAHLTEAGARERFGERWEILLRAVEGGLLNAARVEVPNGDYEGWKARVKEDLERFLEVPEDERGSTFDFLWADPNLDGLAGYEFWLCVSRAFERSGLW